MEATPEISLDEFRKLLSDLFGQELTEQADVAAEDFWKNMAAIARGVGDGSIGINVSVLSLVKSFPQYGGYHVWKGLAIVLFLIGLIVLFFEWKIALGVVLLAVISQTIGKVKRRRSGQRFLEEIKSGIAGGDLSKGLGNLCAHYIAGTVQLTSGSGQAHWPQLPSDVFTGERNLIQA